MALHRLTAARRGVVSVLVDDKTLLLDGPEVDLTAAQVKRLEAIDGVRLKKAADEKPSSTTKTPEGDQS